MEREIRAGLDAWNRHDPDGCFAMCAEDCLLQVNNSRTRGREVMREIARGYFDIYPDFQMVFSSVWVDGNTVVEEWRSTGTHVRTGRRFELSGMGLDQFGEDGRVYRSAVYFDPATLAAR
ncbi:MAG TPA: nuclear transport factor 2 family protein [Solirubrobacteraceae bacterium]